MADFTPHQIASSIKSDLESVMKHPYVTDFMNGLEYKSKKQSDKDRLLISYLFSKCKMYADGWVKANALQTANLAQNAEFIQELQDQIVPVYREMNNVVNRVIVMIKDKIPKEDLDELRKMEIEIQKKLR